MALKLLVPALMAFTSMAAPARFAPTFAAGRPDDVELADSPINPDWIVSGSPQARSGLFAQSRDGLTTTNIWECTAGAFNWTFHHEETVCILAGSVRVTTEDGATRTLMPGDMAFFAGGSTALWEIDDHLRKIAFCRDATPAAVRALRSMRDLMRQTLKN